MILQKGKAQVTSDSFDGLYVLELPSRVFTGPSE